MGTSHFARVQTKFKLENRKEKHFLGVSYCNLQVYLSLGLAVSHTKKKINNESA